MAGGAGQVKELEHYPKYKPLYLMAFAKMLKNNAEKGIISKAKWETAEDVMAWWIKAEDQADTEIMGLIDE